MTDIFHRHFAIYYGTDWFGFILIFISLILLGKHNKNGFLFAMSGNVIYTIFGHLSHSSGTAVANIIFFIINLIGYIRWSKKTNAHSPNLKDDRAS